MYETLSYVFYDFSIHIFKSVERTRDLSKNEHLKKKNVLQAAS